MPGIRVPVYLRDTAQTMDSKAWFKGCDKKEYYGLIDEAAARLSKITGDEAADNESLAIIVSGAVNADESHSGHVLQIASEIKSPEDWLKICTATAWVILQAYYKDKDKDQGSRPNG